MQPPARCYLFVPADKPTMLEKAASRGADALILDLEDAVAPAARVPAFASAVNWLETGDRGRCEIWVRIPDDASAEEIRPLVDAGVNGFVLPKMASAEQVSTFAEPTEGANLIVIIETARGLTDVEAIASVKGVTRLFSGEIDMAADLGVERSNPLAMAPVRSKIVAASAAAGLVGPLASVDPDFSDPDSLEAAARELKAQGFRAGVAIHPAQISPYIRAYSPTGGELARASRLVARYDAALARGEGAIVDEEGKMMDEATVKAARTLVEQWLLPKLGRDGSEKTADV